MSKVDSNVETSLGAISTFGRLIARWEGIPNLDGNPAGRCTLDFCLNYLIHIGREHFAKQHGLWREVMHAEDVDWLLAFTKKRCTYSEDRATGIAKAFEALARESACVPLALTYRMSSPQKREHDKRHWIFLLPNGARLIVRCLSNERIVIHCYFIDPAEEHSQPDLRVRAEMKYWLDKGSDQLMRTPVRPVSAGKRIQFGNIATRYIWRFSFYTPESWGFHEDGKGCTTWQFPFSGQITTGKKFSKVIPLQKKR